SSAQAPRPSRKKVVCDSFGMNVPPLNVARTGGPRRVVDVQRNGAAMPGGASRVGLTSARTVTSRQSSLRPCTTDRFTKRRAPRWNDRTKQSPCSAKPHSACERTMGIEEHRTSSMQELAKPVHVRAEHRCASFVLESQLIDECDRGSFLPREVEHEVAERR